MDTVTYIRVRRSDGVTFNLRMFGDGDTRMTSRGIVFRDGPDAPWRWQTPEGKDVEIVVE